MVLFFTVASYIQLDCTAVFEGPDEPAADFVDSLWPEHERYPMPSAENICFDFDHPHFTEEELDIVIKALRDIYAKLPTWLGAATTCGLHYPRHTYVYQFPADHIKDALRHCNSSAAPDEYSSPTYGLFHSIEHENILGCAIALAAGANVNYQPRRGMTPLQTACWSSRGPGWPLSLNTIKLLLAHGADANASLECGSLPLHSVCQRINLKAIELLSKDGHAKVNAFDTNTFDKQTALHIICKTSSRNYRGQYCKNNHPQSILAAKILLQHGADVNQTDRSGHTPLFYARKQENGELVALLVAHGATE